MNTTKIIRIICFLAILLMLASIIGQLIIYVFAHNPVKGHALQLIRLFQLNHENNIPTLFTVMLMTLISILLWIITILSKKHKAPFVSNWKILTYGFIYMAFDEAIQVHEKFVNIGRSLIGNDHLGIFFNTWVIFFIPLVFMLLLFFIRFLLNLPTKTRFAFLIAASIYLSGSLGMEMFDGAYAEIHGWNNLTYNILANIEDSFEIIGLIVFTWALLLFISNDFKEINFQFNRLIIKPKL